MSESTDLPMLFMASSHAISSRTRLYGCGARNVANNWVSYSCKSKSMASTTNLWYWW